MASADHGLWSWNDVSSELAILIGRLGYSCPVAAAAHSISTEMFFYTGWQEELKIQNELQRLSGNTINVNSPPGPTGPHPSNRPDYEMLRAQNRRLARHLGLKILSSSAIVAA